jgi:formylglycine-generating enzyme required for sulfatase activity
LRSFLDSGKPVVIDFISTGCRSVCPGLSQGFSDLREALGAASDSVQLISLSTDPDSDGPDQMKQYLARYKSGTGWDFLTGRRADISLVMRALNASRANDLSPLPFYFLRGPGSDEWVRVKGTAGASALLQEIRKMESEMETPPGDNALQKAEAKPEKVFPEDYYFAKAMSTKAIADYAEYVRKYPDGAHVREIKELLDKSYGSMLQLVPVKGGCYWMGDWLAIERQSLNPVHEVCVDDFLIGKHAVTRRDFEQFVLDTGYRTEAEKTGGCYGWTGSKWKKKKSITWRNAGFAQDDRHPVVCVSWNDSAAFAEWLSAKTGRKYRLPSEAEWEYAARSGGKQEQYAGFSDEGRAYLYANFCDKNCVFDHKTPDQDDGNTYTAPVGSYKPNGSGLYDMTGNVWQWTNDWYGERYYGRSPKENPKGPDSGQYRVLRGGSWLYEPINSRATHRFWSSPSLPCNDFGFRLASPAQ